MRGFFHVGANADDVIEVNIQDARTKSLGRSAIRTTGVVTTDGYDKANGDLVVQGITIRSTTAVDDMVSTSFASGSAIAKAAAINDAAQFTGVHVRALETTANAANDIVGGTLTNTSFIRINGET